MRLTELESRLTPGWVTPTPMPCDFVGGLYWVPDGGKEAAVVLHGASKEFVDAEVAVLAPFVDQVIVVADPHPPTPQPHVYDIVFGNLPPQDAGFSGEWNGTPAKLALSIQGNTLYGPIVGGHEFGHGVGLQHTDEPDNIMYGVAPVEPNWDGWQVTAGRQFLAALPWNGIA